MDNKGIFRQESIDRISSPDRLDEYIKVSSPSIWLVLIALFVLFASVSVWGFTGTLPKTLTVNGIVEKNEKVVCFIDANALDKDIKGCKVQVASAGNATCDGFVSDVSLNPYSVQEIKVKYKSDWVMQKLVTSDYSYAVTIDLSGSPIYTDGMITNVTIITEEIKPISYLLN
jgi:hypothetical protein